MKTIETTGFKGEIKKIVEQNKLVKYAMTFSRIPVDSLVLTLDSGEELKFRKNERDAIIPNNILEDYLNGKELEVEGKREVERGRTLLSYGFECVLGEKESGVIKVDNKEKYRFSMVVGLSGNPCYEYEQLR